jgi:hypothetical protein
MLRTTSLLQLFLSTTVSALELPYRPSPSSSSSSSSSLDIDVISWREIGEGIQKYVIYQIRYVTSLLCFSKLEWEVSRRYSDFKFLADRLSRYEGALVPPLPPKQMINSLYQDLPVQRSQELSLFLKNIARHPVLYGVLEFRIFLEASQKGFDSFKQMIRTLPECEVGQTLPPLSSAPLTSSSVPHFFAEYPTVWKPWQGHPSQVILSDQHRHRGEYSSGGLCVGDALFNEQDDGLELPNLALPLIISPASKDS